MCLNRACNFLIAKHNLHRHSPKRPKYSPLELSLMLQKSKFGGKVNLFDTNF